VLKQPVRLVVGRGGSAHDSYGRTLGTLWQGRGQPNRLVEEGQAWSIRVKWDQGPYVTQERMARGAVSRGVHKAGKAALSPRTSGSATGPARAGRQA
jgi:endonuclease YncB( thermonuclease family)